MSRQSNPNPGFFGDTKGAGQYAWNGITNWFNKRNAPQIPQNPYRQNYDSLIGQLERSASGQGPSVAGGAYQAAYDTGMKDITSMARGGSAGAARAGMGAASNMNTQLAQGYSNARLQEQLASQQALSGVLGGASNAWFQPQQANLTATMNTKSNGQQLTSFLEGLIQNAAVLFGKKPEGK